MPHSIVTTPGFVIESRTSGEADRYLSIFTRDIGLVRASAKGIRLEKSKLRPFAQEYSFGIFSFVRGREIWRLTSAQALRGIRYEGMKYGSIAFRARLASLLRRLLHGEEAHAGIFDALLSASNFMAHSDAFTTEVMQNLESLTVARILRELGYVAEEPSLNACLSSCEVTDEFLQLIGGQRQVLNRHINKALRESHL